MAFIVSSVFTPTSFEAGWSYSMGYQFTPVVDGYVTKLGGCFDGSKTVNLQDSGFNILASTTVVSANNWSYLPITPVKVSAGYNYFVSVWVNASGGAYGSYTTPFTVNNINVVCDVYLTGTTIQSGYTTSTGYLHGCADIEFTLSVGNPLFFGMNF